jgi:hypothetical protein
MRFVKLLDIQRQFFYWQVELTTSEDDLEPCGFTEKSSPTKKRQVQNHGLFEENVWWSEAGKSVLDPFRSHGQLQ